MKHFISLLDYSSEELTKLLDRADYLSKAWKENRMPNSLMYKQIGLWFYGKGFRNRIAFEMGLKAMGALIYTDCWPRSDDPSVRDDIAKSFLPYQITARHLSGLKPKAMFLPCPPVTRGQEVSEEAMNSAFCLNFRAKEYLLHSQNAIAEMLLTGMI